MYIYSLNACITKWRCYLKSSPDIFLELYHLPFSLGARKLDLFPIDNSLARVYLFIYFLPQLRILERICSQTHAHKNSTDFVIMRLNSNLTSA